MPENRPAVPRELERSLLVEASHRCAIPACRSWPVELAHIVPWVKVREHRFENMIALCPNCHTRFDQGQIDRRAMFQYKANLHQFRPQPIDEARSIERARLFGLYRAFQGKCRAWESAIGAIASADVMGTFEEQRQALVDECTRSAELARSALAQLGNACDADTAARADAVFQWELSWANDVVDGLWPTTHAGADRHDDCGLDYLEKDLHEEACRELDVDPRDFPRREPKAVPLAPLKLGGTGKRF